MVLNVMCYFFETRCKIGFTWNDKGIPFLYAHVCYWRWWRRLTWVCEYRHNCKTETKIPE